MYERRMMSDGRRLPPRNSRGEFRSRRSRRDRGMDYDEHEHRRMRGEREYRNHPEYGYDGHYGAHGGRTVGYEPVEFMGYCTGYAGEKQDYGYRNDMRGRDYGYPMYGQHYPPYDYGYPYDDYGYPVGDFGESLSEKELNEWCEQMKKPLSEQEKQMLSEQVIIQKAKQMGMSMDGFTEKELYVNTVRNYTDHKKSIGQNPDLALKMAYDDFHDEDGEYNGKGSMWLAVYYDNFVEVDD